MSGITDFISKIVGGSTTSTISGLADIVDKFITTPDEKKAFLQQATDAINKHNEVIEQAYLTDIQSARSREVGLASSKGSNWIQPLLAIVSVGGFFGIVGYVVGHGLKSMDSQTAMIVGTLLGTTGSIAVGVYNYYFGSSTGSKTAQETIANIAKQP